MVQTLGAFLRERRERLHPGWSQNELARQAGVSGPTVNRLEGGQTRRPTLEKLARVAPFYGLSVVEAWERGGWLRQADGEEIARLLGEMSPIALIKTGLDMGPWSEVTKDIVKRALAQEDEALPW